MTTELFSIVKNPGPTSQTMSSREIAKLCNKQHKHVRRDIAEMFKALEIDGRGYVQPWTHPQNGQEYLQYSLPKDLCMTLVAGYDIKLRYRIIKRWEELEAAQIQPAPAQIDLNDPDQLLGLLTNYARRTKDAEARIADMAPKVEALNRLDVAEGSLSLRVAAKTLDVPERRLSKWMEVHGWAFRQNGRGPLQAYAQRRKDGFLEHKLSTYQCPKTGEDRTTSTLMITPKGMGLWASRLGDVA